MSEFKENDHNSVNPPEDGNVNLGRSSEPLQQEGVTCNKEFFGIKNMLLNEVTAIYPGQPRGIVIAPSSEPKGIDPTILLDALLGEETGHLLLQWPGEGGRLEKVWAWCDESCQLMYSLSGLNKDGKPCKMRSNGKKGKWILTIEVSANENPDGKPWIVGEVDIPSKPPA